MMRRLRYIVACLAIMVVLVPHPCSAASGDNDRSSVVVHIDGVRYYVHNVVSGNTLYSLSKLYGVSEEQILESNPTITDGLKVGTSVKIPNLESAEEDKVSKRAQRKLFDEHVVAAGETLYAISQRYQMSVSTIMDDNPTLDPASLTIGQIINIRKSELGQSDDSAIQEELIDYSEQLNSVVPQGYKYYVVTDDDTVISIAERSDMSVMELKELNRLTEERDLAMGDIILIRDVDQLIMVDTPIFDTTDLELCFTTLSEEDTLNIALMLPLQMRGYNMKPFAEFYHGFMLGVEDLQKAGRNIIVNLYNTQRDISRVEEILTDAEFVKSDLIVGPVYEELLAPVLSFAEDRNVPVVSPLVSIESSDSPVLFQMAPMTENRYDKIGSLISSDRVVTLIYGETNDTEYEQLIKAMLDSCGMEYLEHQYCYEHISVITDRVKMLEEQIETIEQEALDSEEIPDQQLIDSLYLMMISSSDLRPAMANEADFNTFFIMSDNETEVDRILSSMVSASSSRYSKRIPSLVDSTLMVQVSIRPSPYEVVANPEWRKHVNIDHTIYFNNRVVNFTSYLAGRESEVIREFDSRYSRAYDDIPTLYAYRGYDVVKIFGESAYGKIKYGLYGESFTPLQTTYFFEQADSLSERRVNTNWMRVTYKPNLKFEIE